jgi:hypothetical protein
MSLSPGTRLGPYEIVAPLGAGGMGEVFRAKDPRLGREVAIKVLPAELAHDADRLRRFEVEARSASSLNHANLLTVFELGEVDGRPYLVTELLEGRSLRAVLATGEPVPVRTAAQWGAQIARGLGAAHGRGIVHRDLKPENLFVCSDGRVKILDFGLAKLSLGEQATMADGPTVAGHTATGVVLGTAGYMAPEQVRGEHVDSRADIFSLGCVLYELFGGRRAFGGDTAIESLHAILKDEPPPLGEVRAELPSAYARLVEKCLDKSPAGRFQHAADLAWALESAAASGTQPSSPHAAAPGAVEPVRRGGGRRVVAALAAASLLALGALVGWLAAGDRAGTAESAADWTGELMVGGSQLAYGPRPSPDGSTVAFVVLDGQQSQIAILRPGESRWTQLTFDRTRGPVLSLAWSRDGRFVYFHRAVPSSVLAVPALGGEERLVVEDVGSPAPLPDGSLLVHRVAANGIARIVRFHPGDARSEPVGPEFLHFASIGPSSRLAVFSDGREAVYLGQRTDDSAGRGPALWAIDLERGTVRDLAPGLVFTDAEGGVVAPAVGIDRARDEVLVDLSRGDLHVLHAIPRAGGTPRAVLPLTSPPWHVEAGPDGSVYADQIEIAGSLLRFDAAGGAPHAVVRFANTPGAFTAPLELPGRGVLFTTVQAGRSTLLLASPERTAPFVEIGEETSGPAALLSSAQVAFLVGPAEAREVAVATTDGRIVRRVKTPGEGRPTAFAAMPDGKSVLYGLKGRLLALDTTNGATRALGEADSATVDSATGELVVRGFAGSGSLIQRLTTDGRPLEAYGRNPEIFDEPWSGPVLDRQGRLLTTIGPPASWFLEIGLSTPADRRLRPIPVEFDGDLFTPSWGADGSVLAVGWEYRTGVWRFVRQSPTAPAARR